MLLKYSGILLILLTAIPVTLTAQKKPSFIRGSAPTQCKDKLNEWGWQSSCSCPRKTIYEEKLGLCIAGNTKVETWDVSGTLKGGIFAIGGETSGYILKTKDQTFEIIFRQKNYQMMSDLAGKIVEIQGIPFVPLGIERQNRQAILVEKIAALARAVPEKNKAASADKKAGTAPAAVKKKTLQEKKD